MSEYQALRDRDGHEKDEEPVSSSGTVDWRTNMASLGKKVGEQMNAVGGKLSEQVNVVGDRMKELFHNPTLGERLVEDATSDILIGPDWAKNLQICDLINSGRVPGVDVVKGVKRRLAVKSGHVQLLALCLLETALKNCERLFGDVAAERILDAMVRTIDDPTTPSLLREKALKLIESWGEATEELRYLPVFEETYKSLRGRGIAFPPRDSESLAPIFTPPQTAPAPRPVFVPGAVLNAGARPFRGNEGPQVEAPGVSVVTTPEGPVVVLDSKEILSVARNSAELLSTVLTSAPAEEVLRDEVAASLAAQCRASKRSVQRLVENESQNETLLFEALTVNDELDKVLDRLREMQEAQAAANPGTVLPTPPTHGAPTHAPIPAVPVLGADVDADGGETLVRKRGGVEDLSGGGAAYGGAAMRAPQEDEDEKALAELDAMVFGKPSASMPASGAASSALPGTGATAAVAPPAAAPDRGADAPLGLQPPETTGDAKKNKDDDLIVF